MLPWGAIASIAVFALTVAGTLYHRAYLRPLRKHGDRIGSLEKRVNHLEDFEQFLIGGDNELDDGFLQDLRNDLHELRDQQQAQHSKLEAKVDRLLAASDGTEEFFRGDGGQKPSEDEYERVSGGVGRNEDS